MYDEGNDYDGVIVTEIDDGMGKVVSAVSE